MTPRTWLLRSSGSPVCLSVSGSEAGHCHPICRETYCESRGCSPRKAGGRARLRPTDGDDAHHKSDAVHLAHKPIVSAASYPPSPKSRERGTHSVITGEKK